MSALPINTTQGNYFGTWGGETLGCTDEGFFIEILHKGEFIRFEEFGQNVLDFIKLGADVFVEAVFKEWNAAAVKKLLWQHSAIFGQVDCPGASAIKDGCAKPLVLTPSNCVQATDIFTFHATIMEPEVAARINLNNKVRMVPIRMRCFLTVQGTGELFKYFTVT